MIIRMGKARYAWMTAVPGLSMVVITMWAGYLQIMNNYIPKGLYLLATLAVIVVVLMAIVIVGTVRRWMELLSIKKTVVDPYGDPVLEVVPE